VAEIRWSCTSLPLVATAIEEEDEAMFRVECPRHGSDVLLSEHAIESLHNRPDGIEVRWRCHCGHRGSMLTGRRRAPQVPDA
jgi:hypothetical protein